MSNFAETFLIMASQNKTPDASYLFGWQYQPSYRLIDESTSTVPDMVLSMKDIYERYAVTGDISALPGSIRPYVEDPEDSYYRESPEEPLDILYETRNARMQAEDMILNDQKESSAKDESDGTDDEESRDEEEEPEEPPSA